MNTKIGFPLVIKPLNEGSSVNVFICNKRNFFKNLNKLTEYGEILIERYIPEGDSSSYFVRENS